MEPILYEKFAGIEEGHWWWRGRRAIIAIFLARMFHEHKTYRVLDLGCGSGATIRNLQSNFEGYGIDISETAIRFCRDKGMANVFVNQSEKIPFDDKCFDIVLALDVLEHLDREKLLLEEVRRVLRPNGVIMVTSPAYSWLWTQWDDLNHHKRRYSKHTMVNLLKQNGFTLHFSSYFNFVAFPLAVLRRVGDHWCKNRDEKHLFGVNVPPVFLNSVLEFLMQLEKKWMSWGGIFPWGSSILAIGKKSGY